MELQLQELIEQIKKNGVEAAEAEAASILDRARAEAEQIVAEAQREADKILQKTKEANERMVRSSEEAIRQAGRNMLLSFRESVKKELGAVAGACVADAYSEEALSKLIVHVVEAWAQNTDADDITVLLSPSDLKALENNLLAALKAKMLSGVTLKANDGLDSGFRIAVQDGSVYYDYSAASVSEMLSAYLSPRVTALLREVEDK